MTEELSTAQRSLIDLLRSSDAAGLSRLLATHPELASRPTNNPEHGDLLAVTARVGELELCRVAFDAMDSPDVQRALASACCPPVDRYRPILEFLLARGGNPNGVFDPERGPVVFVPCENVRPDVLKMLIGLGADPAVEFRRPGGDAWTPLTVLLSTQVRDPKRLHESIEVLSEAGVAVVDSPWMAVCRGDEEVLTRHLDADPDLLTKRFDLPCANTPLVQATLLHIAAEFCEERIARLLLARGAEINARAGIDADGFGGQTAIFHTVNSIWNRGFRVFKLLVENGADVHLAADVRHPSLDARLRGATPLDYATRVVRGGAPHPEVVDVLQLVGDVG